MRLNLTFKLCFIVVSRYMVHAWYMVHGTWCIGTLMSEYNDNWYSSSLKAVFSPNQFQHRT